MCLRNRIVVLDNVEIENRISYYWHIIVFFSSIFMLGGFVITVVGIEGNMGKFDEDPYSNKNDWLYGLLIITGIIMSGVSLIFLCHLFHNNDDCCESLCFGSNYFDGYYICCVFCCPSERLIYDSGSYHRYAGGNIHDQI